MGQLTESDMWEIVYKMSKEIRDKTSEMLRLHASTSFDEKMKGTKLGERLQELEKEQDRLIEEIFKLR